MEGGWWVEAASERPQAHGHDKADGLALWMGSSQLKGHRAVCSGLVTFQACSVQCGEWPGRGSDRCPKRGDVSLELGWCQSQTLRVPGVTHMVCQAASDSLNENPQSEGQPPGVVAMPSPPPLHPGMLGIFSPWPLTLWITLRARLPSALAISQFTGGQP